MRTYVTAALVALLGAAVRRRGTALAAAPTKGGVYQGELFATSGVALPKKVRLVVTKTGTSARVIWWCGSGRAPSTLRIQIAPDGYVQGDEQRGHAHRLGRSRASSCRRPRPGWPCSSRPSATARAAPSASRSSRSGEASYERNRRTARGSSLPLRHSSLQSDGAASRRWRLASGRHLTAQRMQRVGRRSM